MITKQENRELVTKPQGHLETGKGDVIIEPLLNDEQLNGKCGLYAKVTIKPGNALAYHQHIGESETYYILSGEGIYNDNGTEIKVVSGDVTYTADGQSHGLKNNGTEDLVFMALIIKG